MDDKPLGRHTSLVALATFFLQISPDSGNGQQAYVPLFEAVTPLDTDWLTDHVNGLLGMALHRRNMGEIATCVGGNFLTL